MAKTALVNPLSRLHDAGIEPRDIRVAVCHLYTTGNELASFSRIDYSIHPESGGRKQGV